MTTPTPPSPQSAKCPVWQPIATFDRTKMQFVLVHEDGMVRLLLWNPTRGDWEDANRDGIQPTHWCECPDFIPDASGQEKEKGAKTVSLAEKYPMPPSPMMTELLQAIKDKREQFFCAALLEYNEVLRSLYQVAARGGSETNWPVLTTRIEAILKSHHATWIEARAFDREKEGFKPMPDYMLPEFMQKPLPVASDQQAETPFCDSKETRLRTMCYSEAFEETLEIARTLERRALAAEAERDTWKRRAEEKEKPTMALGRELEAARAGWTREEELRLDAEEALRNISIICCGNDPSNGEGTLPCEIVEIVQKERDSLTAQLAAAKKALQELDEVLVWNEANFCILWKCSKERLIGLFANMKERAQSTSPSPTLFCQTCGEACAATRTFGPEKPQV